MFILKEILQAKSTLLKQFQRWNLNYYYYSRNKNSCTKLKSTTCLWYKNCRAQCTPSSCHWGTKRHLSTATSRKVAARTSASMAGQLLVNPPMLESPGPRWVRDPFVFDPSTVSILWSSFSFSRPLPRAQFLFSSTRGIIVWQQYKTEITRCPTISLDIASCPVLKLLWLALSLAWRNLSSCPSLRERCLLRPEIWIYPPPFINL